MVTLDIEMPNMNGLQFLDKLMRLHPMPVVMVSTLTNKGASETLLALELGAVDFVAKPSADLSGGIEAFGENLREKVRAAAKSDVQGRAMRAPAPKVPVRTAAAPRGRADCHRRIDRWRRSHPRRARARCRPIARRSSSPSTCRRASPRALRRGSTRSRDLTVVEAEDRMPLLPATPMWRAATITCGSSAVSGQLKCRLTQDELASGHRPSVDVLFESVAKTVGPMAVGAILTGMGRDGARGLKLMRDAGAYTVGQSQASALVYGMPRVAFEEGAVVEQAPVEAIAARLAAALMRLKSQHNAGHRIEGLVTLFA